MAKSYLDKDGLLYFLQKIRPSATPSMDGTASTGTSKRFAAEDHVHPSDTSKAPLASPAFTGTPTAPTADTATSNTQIATTAFVKNVVGSMTSGVADVQIDGTSIVAGGIAEIPKAASNAFGAVKFSTSPGGVASIQGIGNDATPIPRLDSNNLIVSSVLPAATTSTQGAMSAADKTKLDSIHMTNGKIDSTSLPSFVDDVIEAYPLSGQTELSSDWLSRSSGGAAITPETGKIYILMADSTSYATNTQFRWSGTAYVKMLDGGVSSITNAEIDTIVAA